MKSSTSERLIAVASAFVAVAILGVFVVAERTGDVSATSLPDLEADVRMQFDLALRTDLPAYDARTAALDDVIDAFLASPQSPADQALLAQWFHQAIRRTMPGALKPLEPTPSFGVLAATETVERNEPTDLVEVEVADPAAAAGWENWQPEQTIVGAQSETEPVVGDVATSPQTADEASEVTAVAPDVDDDDDVIVLESDRPWPPVVGGPVPELAAPPADEPSRPTTVAVAVSHVGSARPAPATSIAESVDVNLAELRARTAGYHAGLRNVAATITNAGDRLTLAEADAAVSELERLANLYDFVQLYYDSLTPSEAARVDGPRSPVETARRVEAALQRVAIAPDGEFDPFDAEAAKPLVKLRNRVRAIIDR
ncbi:MAG: hypothetical protein KDA44_05640 [Planctomycetales bacterium]|nr:hypothetical protein [Planctomycetales bacterium]